MAKWLQILCVVLSCHIQGILSSAQFPISNCKTGSFELLMIGSQKPLGFSQSDESYDEDRRRLFTNILDLFLNPYEGPNNMSIATHDSYTEYEATNTMSTARDDIYMESRTTTANKYPKSITTRTSYDEPLTAFKNAKHLVGTRLLVAFASSLLTPVTHIDFKTYSCGDENEIREYISEQVYGSSDKESQSNTFSALDIDAAIDFARQAFSKTNGTINNATRVVIMTILATNQTTEIVKKVRKIQNEGDILEFNLFIIMIGFREESEISLIRNTINVQTLWEDELQSVAMAICKQCQPGWFMFESVNNKQMFTCYHVDVVDSFIDWYGAAERCRLKGAALASVETHEERLFLRKELHYYAQKYYIPEFNYYGKQFVYIGLTKDTSTVATTFKWVNGNPLILYGWYFDSSESGNCGAWVYRALRRPMGWSLHSKSDGWENVECGLSLSRLSLCEKVHRQSTDEMSPVSVVHFNNFDNLDKTMAMGEFTTYHEEIVSIPAKIVDNDFRRQMEKEYSSLQLFDCEENAIQETLIPYSFVCDNTNHCSNRRDETICQYRACVSDREFQCNSGECVPSEAHCDFYKDCNDGSDEEECDCDSRERCTTGECLPKSLLFDGEPDCSDRSEEPYDIIRATVSSRYKRRNWKCVFICNRTECVYPFQFNDGFVDCQGPEGPLDESVGILERSVWCNKGFLIEAPFDVWSPRCVYIRDRLDTIIGCRHMSHLENCQSFTCPDGYVKCPESYCIPLHYVQDGNNDCPMGEDEIYTENRTCAGNFACFGSHVCLHPALICDRQPHCPHGDDELNCHVTCKQGFRCVAGTVTAIDYNNPVPLESLSFVDSRVRYLDLSGVDISSVHDGEHLVNLVEVRLSNCQLSNVSIILPVSASNLITVYALDLKHNLITEVPTFNIFKSMENLNVLDLSHNKRLKFIAERAFRSNIISEETKLEELDLSNTGLSFLHKSILSGLSNLRYLNLSYTQIVNFRQDNFPDSFDFELEILDLRHSPIQEISLESLKGLSIESHFYTDNFRLCCPQIRSSGISDYRCHSSDDAISSCFDLLKEDVQRILLWVLGVVSVVGNIVVISVRLVFDKEVLKKSHGLFITNLSISDLIMGLYLLIIAGTDLKYREFYVIYDTEWRSSLTCQFAGFLSTLSSEVSTFFIFLVTLDRFLVIKFPFGQVRFSKTTMVLATVLAWVLGFLLALIPLFFDNWDIYSSNAMCLGLPLTTERSSGWGYSVSIYIGLNFLMFVAIVCGQLAIYRTMSKTRGNMNSASTGNNSRRAQDILVARQLSLVVLSDFFCWFPIGIMGLLALSGVDIGLEAYAWSAILVIPVNSALNPLLYTLPFLYTKLNEFRNRHSKLARTATSDQSRSENISTVKNESYTLAEKTLLRFFKAGVTVNDDDPVLETIRRSTELMAKLKMIMAVLDDDKEI